MLNRTPSPENLPIINTVLLCRDLGVLPLAGGLLDQTPAVVGLLSETAHAQAERQKLDAQKAKNKASSG